MAKNRKLSRKELLQANDLLKEHLIVNEDKSVKYKDGFDDEKLAKMIAPDVRSHAVAGVRLELFGRFGGSGSNQEHKDRIVKLEEVNIHLMKQLAEMQLRFNRLCENLSVNKVVNVTHLVFKKDQ